jgi:rfaE bifunctional protein nucleotidyltransferase chain/domain
MGLVVTLDEAAAFAAEMRAAGKRVVTTNGSFDLLHPGHEFLLAESGKYGDVVIAGVNSDASVKRYKGPNRPIEPQDVRVAKVAAHVDRAFIFEDDTPIPWLPKLRPHVHTNAATYGVDCIEAPTLREIGAELILIPVRKELGSTTEILRQRGLPT